MATRRLILTSTFAALTVLQVSRTDSQKPNEGYVAASDSIRLFYRVVGRGRDTIIAIHGGPGVDLESIFGDFTPLAERHVVIFYDQRGTGRSTLPRDTMLLSSATQISDLDAVRRHFKLDRVVLVAHSYGPLLAATYAIAHPEHVRGMVLLGPVPPRRGDFWQRFGQTMRSRMDSAQAARSADANRRLVAGENVRQACRDYWAIALRPRVADPEHGVARIRSDLCASDPAGIRYGLRTTNGVVMASYGDWDLRPALRTLDVPTLIVHGEEDAIPMDMVSEWTLIPKSRLIRIPHAAHMLYAEQPEVVWPEVMRFLDALPPRKPAMSGPGPEHARLTAMSGTWDVEMTFWFQPGARGVVTKGTSTIRPLLSGLFIEEQIDGALNGTPFTTLSWTGFNTGTQEYEATRISSSNTVRIAESGVWDQGAGHFDLRGSYKLAGDTWTQRTVIQPGADTMVVASYLSFGKVPEWKAVEIRYKKRAK